MLSESCTRNSGVNALTKNRVGFIPSFAPISQMEHYPIGAIPDLHNLSNQYYSSLHRFGAEMPSGQPIAQQNFSRFAAGFLRHFVPVLDFNADLSFETFYQNSNKSKEFRDHLRNTAIEHLDRNYTERDLRTGSFIKHESYPIKSGFDADKYSTGQPTADPDDHSRNEFKPARSINAYNDWIKASLGATTRAFDSVIFGLEWFVKHIPVRERPARLHELFGENPVCTTDFSSFECHHRGVFANVILSTFQHVFANTFSEYEFALMQELLTTTNYSEFSTVDVIVPETLMSGAPWTSSANGFLNLQIMSFLCLSTQLGKDISLPLSDADLDQYYNALLVSPKRWIGRFEGDDGIFIGDVRESDVQLLGIKLKLERHRSFATASFCGILLGCDRDIHGGPASFTEPIKVLVNFFILPEIYRGFRYAMLQALIRAKAFSFYYQYSACPIVGALAYWTLYKTRSIDCRHVMLGEISRSYWHGRLYAEILEYLGNEEPSPLSIQEGSARILPESRGKWFQRQTNISQESRAHFELTYGISIEWQLEFEREIELWGRGLPHRIPAHPLLEPNSNHAREHCRLSGDPAPLISESVQRPRHKEYHPDSRKLEVLPSSAIYDKLRAIQCGKRRHHWFSPHHDQHVDFVDSTTPIRACRQHPRFVRCVKHNNQLIEHINPFVDRMYQSGHPATYW